MRCNKLLSDAIEQAEVRYTQNKINENISLMEQHKLFFSNPNLQSFLINYLQKNNIVEHYATDTNGSILCIHDDKSISQLVIKNVDDIHIPLTWSESENLHEEMINDIKHCRKMLCASIDDLSPFDIDKWSKFLFTASPLPKEPDYFFAVLPKALYTWVPADVSSTFIDDQ
jgi:hypothetical protein